ncbi:MAG: four helix bundle protein [Acidobacteria bacterium]|nr:four helix bundle protein [Acidobacteriota bacterium]
MRRVECFKQLRVWREARSIRKRIYKVTKIFPGFEKYGLSVQMTRAAVSITANIAEGFGRKFRAENIRFCRISRGSLAELRDHLTTAYDEEGIAWQSLRGVGQRTYQPGSDAQWLYSIHEETGSPPRPKFKKMNCASTTARQHHSTRSRSDHCTTARL